jgi:hypothetical protein
MPVGRSDHQAGKKYYDLQKYEPHQCQIKYIQCKINVKFPIVRLLVVSPRQTLQKLRTLFLKSVGYRVTPTVGLHYYVKSQNGH